MWFRRCIRPGMLRLARWPSVLALVAALAACGADLGEADPPEASDLVGREAPAPGPAGGDAPSSPGGESAPGPGAALPACVPMPACDGASSPELGPMRPWNRALSRLTAASGAPYHRGRDRVIKAGEPQVVIGTFTYSLMDVDIVGEEVDVFVERGCGGAWEALGTALTTASGDHATVDDVDDTGGRVYFELPAAKSLAPGRHRVRMVMAADHSFADAILDVVPDGTPVFVSDVDGTLTESETEEFRSLYDGVISPAQPKAAETLSALAAKGIRPVYITARPEWLAGRTHEFLATHGFPEGVVITTSTLTGLFGGAAVAFKTAALERLAAEGAKVVWAFGNTSTDADAYEAASIQPVDQRVFLRIDDPHGGRRVEAYSEVLPLAQAAPAICHP